MKGTVNTMKKALKLGIALLFAVVLFFALSAVVFAEDIPLLTEQTPVELTSSTEATWISFTPETSGVYFLYSVSDYSDTVAVLYDERSYIFGGDSLAYNDDLSQRDGNFLITYNLNAGETYYIGVTTKDDMGNEYMVVCEKVEYLSSNMMVTYNFTYYDHDKYAYIIPTYSGLHKFYSESAGVDTASFLVDTTNSIVAEDDNNGVGDDFMFGCNLTEGQIYILYIGIVDQSKVGTSNVYVEYHTDGWIHDSNGWAYYQNGDRLKNCWKESHEGWSYLGSDGYSVKNRWMKDSKGWVYLSDDGLMLTNEFAKDSSGWCYLGADGYCVKNQWVRESKGWVYIGSDGYIVANRWIRDSVGWCYVGPDGRCVTNRWMKDSHGWCYLDIEGRMATNRWIQDSKGWCYLGADGYAVTNCWKQDSHGWCYLDGNGSMTKNSWVKDGAYWYYLDGNGYMVTGTHYINGKNYTFNSNGVWVG